MNERIGKGTVYHDDGIHRKGLLLLSSKEATLMYEVQFQPDLIFVIPGEDFIHRANLTIVEFPEIFLLHRRSLLHFLLNRFDLVTHSRNFLAYSNDGFLNAGHFLPHPRYVLFDVTDLFGDGGNFFTHTSKTLTDNFQILTDSLQSLIKGIYLLINLGGGLNQSVGSPFLREQHCLCFSGCLFLRLSFLLRCSQFNLYGFRLSLGLFLQRSKFIRFSFSLREISSQKLQFLLGSGVVFHQLLSFAFYFLTLGFKFLSLLLRFLDRFLIAGNHGVS